MRIAFERSGGMAGLVLAATVEADALPPGLAEQATGLDWSSLPAQAPAPTRSDGFTYRLEVTRSGGGSTQVVLGEPPPAELRPLLDELLARARPS